MADNLRKKAEDLLNKNPAETPTLSTADAQKLIHEHQVHQIELEMQNEELRQAQHELAATRDAYVELYDFAPVGYLTINPEGRITEANFTAASLLGIDRGKLLVGRTFAGFIQDTSLNAWDLHRRYMKEHLEKHGVDLELQRSDGSTLTARVECTPRLSDRGEIDRCLMVIMDISRRVRAEESLRCSEQELSTLNQQLEQRVEEQTAELRESEERFRDISTNMTDWIWEVDVAGKYTFASGKIKEVLGYEPDELIGKTPFDLMPEKEAECMSRYYATLLDTKKPFTDLENWNLAKDGKKVCLLSCGAPMFDDNGVLVGYRGVDKDITARKEVEKTLRESEERFRAIFDQVPDGILMADPETRKFHMASQAFCTKMGYSEEQVLEMGSEGIHPAEDLPYVIEAFERQARGEVEEVYDIPFLRRDGGIFYADMKAFRIILDGKPYLLGHVRDISERRVREEEIEKNRKELRKLASELSLAEQRERQRVATELHDGISQMLSSSFIRLGALQESPLPDSALDALDTISGIIQETLQQTRSLTFELSCPMLNELGLAAALEELCASMTHEQAVRFEFNGGEERMPLSTDHEIELYRASRELLINVMKHSGAQRASVELERVGDHARIIVADDGKGFDASLAGNGFSPTGGFGLFSIREYLRHAGGELRIESIPGEGTEVMLTAPLEKVDE